VLHVVATWNAGAYFFVMRSTVLKNRYPLFLSVNWASTDCLTLKSSLKHVIQLMDIIAYSTSDTDLNYTMGGSKSPTLYQRLVFLQALRRPLDSVPCN
jgi:hypothetical protein